MNITEDSKITPIQNIIYALISKNPLFYFNKALIIFSKNKI